ncbi:MAG: hypothetical protein EOP11_07445 [Proteobacteria bacterium]|nr:MAG: hypothetical protein EOP11_07445 [Pseudomonadota bacterium]
MMYRTYASTIKFGFFAFLTLSLTACATGEKSVGSVSTDENNPRRYDGREPASLHGDFTWLNQVEDDFGRIADETSTRAVASSNQQETLMKDKNWSFSYLPKTNHFYVDLGGTAYRMVQTRINDGERFAFAAEGQAENPLTFSVARGEGRTVASSENEACETEISYWSKKTKSYVTDRTTVKGKNCQRMISLLKDYVP